MAVRFKKCSLIKVGFLSQHVSGDLGWGSNQKGKQMGTTVRRRCTQCGSAVQEDSDGDEHFYVCANGCFYTSARTPPALLEMLLEELTMEDSVGDDEQLMLARASAVERLARAAGMSLFGGEPPVQLELVFSR